MCEMTQLIRSPDTHLERTAGFADIGIHTRLEQLLLSGSANSIACSVQL